jgi:hypothetical protein
MKCRNTFASTCVAATLFIAPHARAQCPAGVTDPRTVLVGTWTYEMRGSAPIAPPRHYTAAGRFAAFIGVIPGAPVGTPPVGRLTITQSSSEGARQEVDAGTFQVFADCSGGTLTFNLSQRFLQFDFWFDENFSEIRFVSTTSGVSVKGTAENQGAGPVPQGSCQPSSSLSVLVLGKNVVSYVPRGSWGGGATGVSAVNVEGTSTLPTTNPIPTAAVVNSCASNPVTNSTVCTANNASVYVIPGNTATPIVTTLTSAGTGSIGFSGGSCTNCGVAMDAVNNRAVIGLSLAGVPGFQFLDLATNLFGTAFPSQSGDISEDVLIDPIGKRLLSAAENRIYEIIDLSKITSPTLLPQTALPSAFFEHNNGAFMDSSGEDCSTGIALAPLEVGGATQVYIANLSNATFTPGSPAGTWTAVGNEQIQTLTGSNLNPIAGGIAVAQGTHTGVLAPEFGGNAVTAFQLPATPGSPPAIGPAWETCSITGFSNGNDPHTVTAYQSPNDSHAYALLANGTATQLARVDLTAMLALPSATTTHVCTAAEATTFNTTMVTLIAVP